MSDASPLIVPRGFRASAVRAGIKPSGNLDLALFASIAPCAAAGTFTTNRIAAAPVRWDRALVPSGSIRGLVVNAGNANAATGAEGLANARATAEAVARGLGCEAEGVLVASTGVIGRQLPMDKVRDGVARALAGLSPDESGFRDASEAILTTDTHPKFVALRKEIGGVEVRLLGLCKGAAMIGPRMATMLAFLLTDAPVDPLDLNGFLGFVVDETFNCVSVEGHASTNDTVLLLANGEAGGERLKGTRLCAFSEMVETACVELARMIPGDGEGATHRITIDVQGARSPEEARAIARAVADSPLVKTAVHGADPNWGRIVSAAGYSGVDFEESDLSLWLNGTLLYKDGVPSPFDADAVSADLRANRETSIRLALALGASSCRFWTCDLTAEYVRLNADYTT